MLPNLEVIDLGRVSYQEARAKQNAYVEQRISGTCQDLLLLCEHPPTLTLGKRAAESDLGFSRSHWQQQGVEVIDVDRGGSVTYHGPGQLLLYPVLSLPERGLGVRTFVLQGLKFLAEVLAEFGVEGTPLEEPAGVWLPGSDSTNPGRKIAAVGLRIQRGVSNHGFSLNVSCDLRPYSQFVPCGLLEAGVTSLLRESPKSGADLTKVVNLMIEKVASCRC